MSSSVGEERSITGSMRSMELCRPPTLPLPGPFDGKSPDHVSFPTHWKKAAEAMQCSHYEEVRKMIKQFNAAHTVVLRGTTLTVAEVTAVTRRAEVRVELDEASAKERVERSYQWVANNIARGTDTYGVTTGFGATSHRRTDKAADLQKELIRFLNAGVVGKECLCLPAEYTRAAMLVRTNTLMQGYSGIRWQILDAMRKLIKCNIAPKLPLRGTITASGDLVPLSYISGLLTAHPNSKALALDGPLIPME